MYDKTEQYRQKKFRRVSKHEFFKARRHGSYVKPTAHDTTKHASQGRKPQRPAVQKPTQSTPFLYKKKKQKSLRKTDVGTVKAVPRSRGFPPTESIGSSIFPLFSRDPLSEVRATGGTDARFANEPVHFGPTYVSFPFLTSLLPLFSIPFLFVSVPPLFPGIV